MKKFKKINLDQVKEFLFNHGEKAALGTCVFLALLFGSLGLLRALSAGRDTKTGRNWKDELNTQYQTISTNMNSAKPAPLEKSMEEKLLEDQYKWQLWASDFITRQYIWIVDKFSSNKRENPLAMTIKTGPKSVQLDYLRAPVLTYEYNANSVKGLKDNDGKDKAVGANNSALRFLRAAQPRRFVVGSAVFPMKQQLEEYVRALRMKGEDDLFKNPDDLPRPIGINVLRDEVLPGGKLGKREIIVYYDAQAKQLKMSESLKKFLRDAIYDENVAEALAPYLYEGFDMPIPTIAGQTYPALDLDGIKVDFALEAEPKNQGGMPKKVGPREGAGGGVTIGGKPKQPRNDMPKKENDPNNTGPELALDSYSQNEVRDADPSLAERLFKNEFNLFHVLGQFAPLVDEKGPMNPPQPNQNMPKNRFFSAFTEKDAGAPNMKGPGGERPKGFKGREPVQGGPPAAGEKWDRDALVRFIDVDVEPGKTYQYSIQVRLKNPNFNKKDEVQFHALANVEELPPPSEAAKANYWVTTPPITIPYEYAIYAVDQPLLDAWSAGKSAPAHDGKTVRDHTSFQVHQWITAKEDLATREQFVIGDWAIAEHLYVRKGDSIGPNAVVKVPVWQKMKDGFEVPERIKDGRGKAMRTGLKLDLTPPEKEGAAPPILVDFYGGKRLKGPVVEEETAVDALLLASDGKLIVFNSRDDSDSRLPAAKERQDRVNMMRQRVDDVMRGR